MGRAFFFLLPEGKTIALICDAENCRITPVNNEAVVAQSCSSVLDQVLVLIMQEPPRAEWLQAFAPTKQQLIS